MTVEKSHQTTTFHVDGISCLDCAAGFEKDVAALPRVVRAVLNPTTGKLTVVGDVDLSTIQRIARGENYTVTREDLSNDERPSSHSFIPKAQLISVALSGISVVIAYIFYWMGTDHWAIPFFVVATLAGGWSNMKKAYYSLPRLNFNMSVLMTVAVFGAMAIGEWGEGAVVAFLFALSDMLEAWSLSNARRSINSLMNMAPKTATVLREGKALEVPVEHVDIGDRVLIRPGETVSMDGTVIEGESSVDQSPITGESIPVAKSPGDTVFSGTINTSGALQIHVDKRAEDTTFAKILQLVEEAQTKGTSTQTFVDRFAAVYTPIVMIIAALVATAPPILFGLEWAPWIYRGLALLVVACPCALVVSTPIAIVSAMSHAAKSGVLIKGGIYLEEAANVSAIAFDKTGTLTRGKPVITDIIPLPSERQTQAEDDLHLLLQVAVTIESYSEHPIATAIMDEGRQRGIEPKPIENFQARSGLGATALFQGKPALAGNVRLFSEQGFDVGPVLDDVHRLQDEGKTVVLVGWDDALLGVIAVADDVRDTSFRAIDDLKKLGIEHTVMITGDHERSARHIATRLNLDAYAAQLLPEDKVDVVHQLVDDHGKVAMVGDGINDAPALAAANVGVAMGGAGTDAALETADIVLMGDDLAQLPYTIQLSRRTLGIIKQNIYFSIIIKVIAVVAVFPGWLTLWLAILSDMGATIIVTLNGMRLLKRK